MSEAWRMEEERRRIARELLEDLAAARERLRDARARAFAVDHPTLASAIGALDVRVDACADAFAQALGIDKTRGRR